MGKNRDKQRTKGNLKPSSSGRAAALVTRDGTLGFVGFDGQGSSNLGYVPMTTSAGDEVDNTVDGSFRMVMRKLTKRDSLTKYKALQEFCELCKSSKSEVVEGVLPFWPRLYNKLAMDVDQRVREATQEAMFQLVQRVGRNLAPYLKSLIGAWLCAQFDSYAPVASSAQRAFLAAFSETKQIEALMFCKVGLCEFLEDNILRQTAETLSDPKIVSKEECEAKYNRVVSSSLLALGYLMTVSSDEVNDEMQPRYQEIFEEKRLWKLARHSSPLVRSAVFSLVISSCMKIPTVVQSVCSQVCPVVLSSLDESEPAVCQNLWGAVLFVMKTIPDCWLHVNVRKAVLPKLWSVLSHGGYGCASVIYPSLLPFISTLPQEVVSSGVGFYQNFFDNLQEGLQEQRVLHSPSECAVVMATYMECLRYCLVQSSLQENGWSVKGYLIKDQLLPLMRKSLHPNTLVPTTHLYIGISDLLNFLNKNLTMETSGPKKDGDVPMATSSHGITRDTITMKCKQEALSGNELVVEEAETILDWFWQGFNSICMDVLTKDKDEKLDTPTIDSLASCILGLKSPSTIQKKQKKQKVVFANPKAETLTTKTAIQPMHPASSDIKIEDLYGGQLLETACDVCHLCVKKLKSKSTLHLKLFSSLFPHFISDKILQVILEKNPENEQNFVELCEELLSTVVNPLLTEFSEEIKNLSCVMDILFGVLSSYTLQSQIDTLNNVLQINNSTDFMHTLLQKGIKLSISGMSTWLASQSGSEKIQKLLRVARCDGSDLNEESFWGIIQLCIADQKTGPLVNMSCLDIIMDNIGEMLRTSKNDKRLSSILGVLHGYFEWCRKNPGDLSSSSEDILLSLFLLQLSDPSERVLDTWKTGLQAVSMQNSRCNVILVRTTAIINEQLKAAQSIDRVLSLSGSAVHLLKAANNLSTDDGLSTLYVNKIYHSLLPDPTQCTLWREKNHKGGWLGSYLCSSMPMLSQIPETQMVTDILDAHQKIVTLAVLVTKTVLTDCDGLTADPIRDDVLVRLYLEAAWIHVWCQCVLGCRNVSDTQKSSTFTQQLPKIHNLSELMSRTLPELQSVLKERQILGLLFQESLMVSRTKGWLWTVVFTDIIQQLSQSNCDLDLSGVLTELHGLIFDTATSSFRSDENREAIIQSIASLLPYIGSIYDVKVITEQGNKYFDQELSTEEFGCVFPLVSSSLSTWSNLTNTSEEAKMEYQLTLIETLDCLMEWKNKHDRILLLNAALNDVTAAELTINIAILNIIKLAVQDTPTMLTSNHWDFILCGIAGWLQTCEENFSSVFTSILTNNLCQETFKVLVVISKHFQDLPEQPQKEPAQEQTEITENDESNQDGTPSSLLAEWKEFFSINLYNCVISIFLKAAEMSARSTSSSLPFVSTCESLGLAMKCLPISILESYEFAHVSDGDDTLPQWAQDVLHYTLPLVSSSVYPLQITAYLLLARIMPILASCHTHKENQDEESEIQRSPPVQLMQVIDTALSHMLSILDSASVPFGTRLCLASDNESRTHSFILFMSCRLLIIFFQQTNVQVRPEYALFLRKNKLIDKLMSVLFRIIPLDGSTAVTEEYELSVKDDVTENIVQNLGRCLYYSVLHWMPAMVRQWFNRLEKKYANVVDKYTSSYVTPSLCQREMAQVKNSSLQFSNMQVRARPVAGEVAAVYTVDDLSMELVVKLADNHPLGVVTVDSGKKVGVTTSQWRSWILQLTTFLTHQNGSIMDGLVLWKQNADKHFEGVEDCMICFSVIHASNYSLPKLSCRTCKKKFHNICLYRWFSTSNNSTCPLCRNIF